MADKLKLLAALALLDVSNDNHWTQDGAPRLDTLKFHMQGEQVTREDINTVAPGFSRANPLPQQGTQAAPGAANAAMAGVTPQEAPNVPPAATQASSEGAGDGKAQGTGTVPASQEGAPSENVQEDAYAIAEREYHEAVQIQEKAKRYLEEKTAAFDRAIQAREGSKPSETLAHSVNAYHESQKKLLQERARRLESLKGINLKDILPGRAPLDQAFTRNKGLKRPQ